MFLTLKDEPEEIKSALESENGNAVTEIPISEIDDFPDHPFHVVVDDAMNEMADSIKKHGVLTPAVVRKKDDGRYELISGHRRKKACEIAGIDFLPAVVREMDRDESIIFMVDSNLQREKLLPSEKAFSYKMRLEAMNRKAGKVVFHSLRHSSTTYKLKLNNGDMKAVQGDTGHAQLKMVSDVYSHILDEDRRYNAEKMERDFYKKAEEKVSTEPTAKPTNAATEQLMNLLNSSPDLAAQLLQMLTANQTGQAVTA